MFSDDELLSHLRGVRALTATPFDQVVASARELVTEWREDEGATWREPWVRAREGVPEEPHDSAKPEDEPTLTHRVGFDQLGRPVFSETRIADARYPICVWRHEASHVDRLHDGSVTRLLLRDARIVGAVSVSGANASVERWTLRHGVPLDGAEVSITRRQHELHRYDVVLGDDGELVRIDVGYERARRDPDDELALVDGLARARNVKIEWSVTPTTWSEMYARHTGDTEGPGSELPMLDHHPHDRAGVRAAMVEVGLDAHADRLVRDAIVDALRLDTDHTARSRLGGPGLLPAAASWPRDAAGRPLTFVAGIDLSELPAPGPLPERGWLLFFADLATEDGEGLIEESGVGTGDPARLLWADDPVDATPPDDLEVRLGERRVRPVPAVALPDDYEAAERLGLTDDEGMAYGAVTDTLLTHGMLGPWSGTQGHPPEPGSVLLLHLEPDDDTGFDILDAGTLQFRIPADALARRDWDEAFAVPESA